MENPYEAPATRQQARETLRSLWSRRLQCPHCQQPGVSVGRAFLAHPYFRVRCDSCAQQSRVKYSVAAVKREVALTVGLTVLGSLVVAWLLVLDSFVVIYSFLLRWLPGFRGANFTLFGIDGQLLVSAIVTVLIAFIPILTLGAIVLRNSLNNAAFHSHLIPVHSQRSPRNGE